MDFAFKMINSSLKMMDFCEAPRRGGRDDGSERGVHQPARAGSVLHTNDDCCIDAKMMHSNSAVKMMDFVLKSAAGRLDDRGDPADKHADHAATTPEHRRQGIRGLPDAARVRDSVLMLLCLRRVAASLPGRG